MLLPFMGFLLDHGYRWDAEPEAVREYTRQFLRAWECVIKRAWDTHGFGRGRRAIGSFQPEYAPFVPGREPELLRR
jgi:hypothetical protein